VNMMRLWSLLVAISLVVALAVAAIVADPEGASLDKDTDDNSAAPPEGTFLIGIGSYDM